MIRELHDMLAIPLFLITIHWRRVIQSRLLTFTISHHFVPSTHPLVHSRFITPVSVHHTRGLTGLSAPLEAFITRFLFD